MFHVTQPAPFQPDYERFIYEPRVLWSIASVNTADATAQTTLGTGEPLTVVLDKQHFKNASRYPLRLTHILTAPVGYLFSDYPNTSGVAPTQLIDYDSSGGIINRCQVRISAPFSYEFQNVLALGMQDFAAEPSGEPSCRKTRLGNEYASGLFGITRWDFDQHFYLPARGSIQFDMSTVVRGSFSGDIPPEPYTTMLFNELGGELFNGHARVREPGQAPWATVVLANPQTFFPNSPAPVPLDEFTQQSLTGTNRQVWQPSQMFRNTEFRKQNAARGVTRVPVTGFAAHINQIEYDDTVYAEWANASARVAPMSLRIITQAKTTDGGTGEWWWRPGAPLALVSPTITPALVKKLDQPIWLAPNEYLEISVTVPAPVDFGEITLSPIYNVGVSLAGQAVVEMG